MSSYQPTHWNEIKLPAQSGALRFTGVIPLNVANDIRVAAPAQISCAETNKLKFVYPIAMMVRRMDYETLRLQAAYEKDSLVSAATANPSHVILRLKSPDGGVAETSVEDLAKAPTKAEEDSPFALDLDYAYKGVSVNEWEIERSRVGAQATTREYLFDLHLYFPQVNFSGGAYEVQVQTLGLVSAWIPTVVHLG